MSVGKKISKGRPKKTSKTWRPKRQGAHIWKFMIGADPVPDTDSPQDAEGGYTMYYTDCMAAAVSTTMEGAIGIIADLAAREGVDARWLRFAKVAKLPIKAGTFIMMSW